MLEIYFFSRSVTLVGEADRRTLKAAIKHSSGEDKIRHRIVAAEVVQTWFEKIESLNSEIADILTEEKEERQVRLATFFLCW
jgi:ATP-dependent RNA helicase DDX27